MMESVKLVSAQVTLRYEGGVVKTFDLDHPTLRYNADHVEADQLQFSDFRIPQGTYYSPSEDKTYHLKWHEV